MALKGLKQSILVCLGWCNKIPKTGQIMSNRNLFHTILELEVQDQGTGRFCVWWIFASGSQTAIFLLYRLGMEGARELCLFSSFQFSSVAQSCPTLCNPMDCSTPGLPDHHQLLKPSQIHVHWAGDAIQPSHPLSSPSPPAFNLSQHQGLSLITDMYAWFSLLT